MDQKYRFKLALTQVQSKLNTEDLLNIAFVYDKDELLEKGSDIFGLWLFRNLLRVGSLKHDDGASIGQLIETLNEIGCSEVTVPLKEYCHKWNIKLQFPAHEAMTSTTPGQAMNIGQSMNTISSTEDLSSDDCHKLPEKNARLTGITRSGKGPSLSAQYKSPDTTTCSQRMNNRKRRKIGAVSEDQLRMEDDEFCLSGEDSDTDIDPAEPSDDQDARYMKMALEIAKQSPDENTQVGAVIVDTARNVVLGEGYNQMPLGNINLPWGNDYNNLLASKYPFVFHAAKAAMKDVFMNRVDLEGAVLYTTLFPANTDAQWIAECRIKELVYLEDTHKKEIITKAARKIFQTCNVKYRRMELN